MFFFHILNSTFKHKSFLILELIRRCSQSKIKFKVYRVRSLYKFYLRDSHVGKINRIHELIMKYESTSY